MVIAFGLRYILGLHLQSYNPYWRCLGAIYSRRGYLRTTCIETDHFSNALGLYILGDILGLYLQSVSLSVIHTIGLYLAFSRRKFLLLNIKPPCHSPEGVPLHPYTCGNFTPWSSDPLPSHTCTCLKSIRSDIAFHYIKLVCYAISDIITTSSWTTFFIFIFILTLPRRA